MTFKDELKRWRETILKKTLERFPERKDEFQTSSGISIPRLSLPAQPATVYERTRFPRRIPVYARRAADHVPLPLVDHAPVRRVCHRGRIEPALPLSARSRDKPASPWPSTCRPRSATTPTTPSRRAKWARWASRFHPSKIWHNSSTRFRSIKSRPR